MLALTSGLPCQITFHEEGEEKIITDESITNIQCEMFDNFIDFPKQLCFNSKIMISCDKKCIKFRTSPNLKHFLSEDPKTGAIIIKSGIKPIGEEFKIEFYLPKEVEFAGGNVRFTIASVYEKREKTMTIMRTETIKVLQGTTEKGEKEEIEVMGQELKEKLRAKGKSGARILAQDENRNRNTVILDGNMMINNRKVQFNLFNVDEIKIYLSNMAAFLLHIEKNQFVLLTLPAKMK